MNQLFLLLSKGNSKIPALSYHHSQLQLNIFVILNLVRQTLRIKERYSWDFKNIFSTRYVGKHEQYLMYSCVKHNVLLISLLKKPPFKSTFLIKNSVHIENIYLTYLLSSNIHGIVTLLSNF